MKSKKRAAKKIKPKVYSVSQLRKKVDKLFSEYIRRRGSDWRGMAQCVTCGLTKPYKEMQAGHFIPGRHPSVVYNEKNCHVQCYGCNVGKKGNMVRYFRYMQDTYGELVISELEDLDARSKQFTPLELLELIEDLKEKLKCLTTS